MEYCKLQIGCLLIVLYIAFIYCKERRRFQKKQRFSLFDRLLVLGIFCIITDGMTAYTVNHLDSINETLNRVLHMFFLIGLDSVIFSMFVYMLLITGGLPKKTSGKLLLNLPFVVNVLVVVLNMDLLEYCEGVSSNYAMGVPAYTCFVMAGVYLLLSLVTFFRRWNYIESHKRMTIFTYLLVLGVVTTYQAIVPEALVTGIATTVIILGIYLNLEDPAMKRLSHYHSEMVMGFATLVENKDDSTGGHVRRTTAYVQLLAETLRDRGYYTNVLTKDYVKNLCMAAPMHDIGKISIPDAVLQKPGKLTDEEFAIMKTHTVNGGKVIQDTFGKLENDEYRKMAYEVARYHHEKWNGKGYPEGLKEREIPLCARIMAVADVFDAISEKRCYRDAMPLEQCFDIIAKGSGQDFDPVIAGVFLDMRDKVEEVHRRIVDHTTVI